MATLQWGSDTLSIDESSAKTSLKAMVPPASGGDGSIFVSLVSYRDGERCGRTIYSIFDNAKDPDKVVVGLVEQNESPDQFCIEQYCKIFDVELIKREPVRDDTSKIMRQLEAEEKCPRLHQIRLLATHHYAAKGPIYARSLMRKVLGNEEFCLQMDAHSSVTADWDQSLVAEWRSVENEFAVLSTVPASINQQQELEPGGENESTVPRQCQIKFRDNGVPDYESPADAHVQGLTAPLLSHGWSAAFSFAKCHLEETVPYDPFSFYAMPIEQYTRFARMWTRGYDVYTPTRNYVFHDYGEQKNGHGNLEWFKKFQRNRFRVMAIDRAKLILELPQSQESDTVDADRANLGIYGLGQRRSLQQLQDFTHVNLSERIGNVKGRHKKVGTSDATCLGHALVPYQASISPLANLHHDGATRLDPFPIFPLRTLPVFSTLHVTSAEAAEHLPERLDTANLEIAVDKNPPPAGTADGGDGVANGVGAQALPHVQVRGIHQPFASVGPEMLEQANLPPPSVLLVLWMFGLVVWCFVFAVQNTSDKDKSWLPTSSTAAGKSKKSSSSSSSAKESKRKTKYVKDV